MKHIVRKEYRPLPMRPADFHNPQSAAFYFKFSWVLLHDVIVTKIWLVSSGKWNKFNKFNLIVRVQ